MLYDRNIELGKVMHFPSIPAKTRMSFIQAGMTDIPVRIIAPRTVIEVPSNLQVADIAEIFGVNFDKVVLPVTVAGLALSQTVAADIVVAPIAFLAVRVWPTDDLVADVAFQVDFHVGV